MHHPKIRRLVTLLVFLACSFPAIARANESRWQPLFNGRDLSGWDTHLAKPQPGSDVPGLARDAQGKYTELIGLNRDPLNVFTVTEIEGRPALRFSGEVFGTITTKASYSNYHIRLRFKWGQKKWPPRATAVRDSGLLYHVHGALGEGGATWPRSVELQIQEQDTGDLWTIGTRISVHARAREEKLAPIYDGAADAMLFGKDTPGGTRCVKAADHEKPHGEWNTVELICVGGESLHIVNGHVVMRLSDPRQQLGDSWAPLASGRISLQSEGAEVFYRDIEVRPVTEIPAEYR